MTKSEFQEKLDDAKNKHYLVGVEPKVVSSTEFDFFKEKEKIYREYIKSLEKSIEYLNNENHRLSQKIEEFNMNFKLWKERYV